VKSEKRRTRSLDSVSFYSGSILFTSHLLLFTSDLSFLLLTNHFPQRVRYIQGMSPDLQIVLCTTPDRETAEMIADTLVSQQLAACVNILPGVTSVYRWKGSVEHSEELLLVIKTSQTVWPMLEAQIQALHPYELPEIVAVPIKTGEAEYIQWLENSIPSA